jgi:hypothetical protein
VFWEIETKRGPIADWQIETFTPGRSEHIPVPVIEVMEVPGMSWPEALAITPLTDDQEVIWREHPPMDSD